MLFVSLCFDKPESYALRDEARAPHLAFIEANKARVKIAGPFLDSLGRMNGSLLIVESENEAEARALLAKDPYAEAGLFERVEIRPWRWTVGALT